MGSRRACALSAALLALGVVCAGVPAPASPPDATRVAVFGVDAADWAVIDPLVARGQLPTFARLKRVAATGVLRADAPLLSPLIWTTIATGKPPEEHGVLDFLVDGPGGVAPVNGGVRRVKAMWEIWSNAGRDVAVTGWWATWPADRVRGAIVSDRVAVPHLRLPETSIDGLVFPPDRWPEIARLRTSPGSFDLKSLNQFLPVSQQELAAAVDSEKQSASGLYRNKIAHLRAALAASRTYERSSTMLATTLRPQLWAVYYELVDTVSHLFIRDPRADMAIAAAYREMDRALADAARALDPATVLVVVSDHGFQRADAGVREDPSDLTSGATAWHRPAGIVAVTSAGALSGRPEPSASRTADLGFVSPLDILPTLLCTAGLPLARDLPGRVLPTCSNPVTSTVASYGEHDQPVTAAGAERRAATEEAARLRALGYISGTAPATSLARVNLGEILYRKGDYRGALRELQAVVRADPLNDRASLWLARTFAALGQRSDALRQYDLMIQAAVTMHRAVDPIVFLAATDLDVLQQHAGAAAVRLARVPSALADSSEVLTARGALAEAEGRSDEAERHYRRALDVAPSDVQPLQRLVDLLLRTSRPAAASSITAPLARRYPSSAVHQSLAGESAIGERRYRDAEVWFSKAVALDPEAVSPRVELGRVRLLLDNADGALEAVRPLAPSRDVDIVRGAAQTRKGDWTAAAASYERALGKGEVTVELLNALGYAQLQAGQSASAVATFERSLRMKADQADIRKLLEAARAGRR